MSDPIPTTTPVPPPTTPAAAKTSKPSLTEKITLLKSAWNSLAPDTKFGNMTLAEYGVAANAYVGAQAAVELGKVNRAAAVVTKDTADAATLLVLNQTVASIKGEPTFGPDSGLYRACGYIPNSERSAPTPIVAGAPVTKKPSMPMYERLALVTNAWETLAPDTKFAGRTVIEFKAATAGSKAARDAMDTLQATQDASIVTRDEAEVAIRRVNQQLVAGVIVAAGKASPIYHAMGYKTVGPLPSVATALPAA
jgi:hypothetical protein